jgi:hypothetical protein
MRSYDIANFFRFVTCTVTFRLLNYIFVIIERSGVMHGCSSYPVQVKHVWYRTPMQRSFWVFSDRSSQSICMYDPFLFPVILFPDSLFPDTLLPRRIQTRAHTHSDMNAAAIHSLFIILLN